MAKAFKEEKLQYKLRKNADEILMKLAYPQISTTQASKVLEIVHKSHLNHKNDLCILEKGESVDGDFYNVIGLPEKITEGLKSTSAKTALDYKKLLESIYHHAPMLCEKIQ
jgi:hypothetical protein